MAWIYIAALILILIIAACAAVSIHVGWKLTHRSRAELTATPAAYGLTYEEISFPSRSGAPGVMLQGWFIPHRGPNRQLTVIFAHGYGQNREQNSLPVLGIARELADEGYDVLLFDFRASGLSEGGIISLGVYERYDLLGAVDWARARTGGHPVVAAGYSMGASTALLAAADEEAIAGVIADSPFSHLTEYLRSNLPHWSRLPRFPFTPMILTLLPPITGIAVAGAEPIHILDRIAPRPVLFIHSKDDMAIPCAESKRMAALHPEVFELWLTEGAAHVETYNNSPVEYMERMLAFLAEIAQGTFSLNNATLPGQRSIT